jgi:hypothetical protein
MTFKHIWKKGVVTCAGFFEPFNALSSVMRDMACKLQCGIESHFKFN